MERPPLTKRLKRYLRYLLIAGMLRLLQFLPLGMARTLGMTLGGWAYALAGGERRKALKSLARAFPDLGDAERDALGRGAFRHLAAAALEVASTRALDAGLEALVAWPAQDRQVLESALAKGKGVVFVSGHVGNWELLARRVAKAGYPSQSIAKETSDPRLTALVEDFRAKGGVRSIWRGQEGAARAMLRALRSGEILGILIDQDTRVQSVFVPFFGELAATPRAAADLALRTGAAVVVGFCQRDKEGYRLTMEEVPAPDAVEREAAVQALTTALSQRIEAAIRRAPEQWVWMHQRWKTRPPGDVSPALADTASAPAR
ncbi:MULTISPECIES: lysophospholipid acyltransferase family protein [Corallococcus]|uniref:lysophospholipid acyltransferase family protein n=1 Tax=Corallococcus TaxID=83461 RepID=UPI00117F9E18|nr:MULTISPECIES: lysophospholipid acyltransferase family protein [Corallococcus]NBD07502.1 lipid A biosynthesis acyltransferase [Corallococcus silvisoli]TSC33509.1 lipid A biosynthesis acyltransferase [Corallococcus sp. Z5C101001]